MPTGCTGPCQPRYASYIMTIGADFPNVVTASMPEVQWGSPSVLMPTRVQNSRSDVSSVIHSSQPSRGSEALLGHTMDPQTLPINIPVRLAVYPSLSLVMLDTVCTSHINWQQKFNPYLANYGYQDSISIFIRRRLTPDPPPSQRGGRFPKCHYRQHA